MKIWQLYAHEVDDKDQDGGIMVVVAPDEQSARETSPSRDIFWTGAKWAYRDDEGNVLTWQIPEWTTDLNSIEVIYLGEAAPGLQPGLITRDFAT